MNALHGVDAVEGSGAGYASPGAWSPGEGLAHVIEPGATDSQSFSINGAVTGVSALTHSLIGVEDYSFTTADESTEHGLFTTPDYVRDITDDIPAGTDLLEVKMTKPYEQFNPTDSLTIDPSSYNNWRVHVRNWTDLNAEGEYRDGDAVVAGSGWEQIAATGDMQTEDYIRFTYGYDFGPSQQARVGHPLDRVDDGSCDVAASRSGGSRGRPTSPSRPRSGRSRSGTGSPSRCRDPRSTQRSTSPQTLLWACTRARSRWPSQTGPRS